MCIFSEAIKSGYLKVKLLVNSVFAFKSHLEYHLLKIFSWHSKTLGPSLFSLCKLISPNWFIKLSKETSVTVLSSLTLSIRAFPNCSRCSRDQLENHESVQAISVRAFPVDITLQHEITVKLKDIDFSILCKIFLTKL